jgi:hypothetical protein
MPSPKRFVLIVLAAAAPWPAARGRAGEKPAAPGMADGKIQGVRKELRRLLGLAWKGRSLRLNRERWRGKAKSKEELIKELEAKYLARGMKKEDAAKWAKMSAGNRMEGSDVGALVEELRGAAGCNSYSRSGGGERFNMTFSGGGMIGRVKADATSFRLALTEEDDAERTVSFRDDGDGTVRIVVQSTDGDFFFCLVQDEKGACRVTHLVGDKLHKLAAKDFAEFFRKNRSYAQEKLLPLLEHMGIVPPLLPGNPELDKAVLARLRPLSDEERAAGEKLLAELDAEAFTAREAASKKLVAMFGRYRALILAKSKDPKASIEAKDRLDKVLEKCAAPYKRADEAIAALGLLEDPGYLVALLERAAAADRAALAAQLRKVTGQKLGEDPAAWKAWLAKGKAGAEEKPGG